jgi:purine-binding chemotaxis protein CheW
MTYSWLDNEAVAKGARRDPNATCSRLRPLDPSEERAVFAMSQDISIQETHHSENTGTMQLVSFRLANEEYGVEITKVQEIILMGEITRVPQTPDYIKGLINLRSTVIPIVDLRLRFGLAQEETSDETRIMVVNVAGKTIGIIVDAVSEVLRISHEQISPPPPTVAGLGREYLTGLVKLDNRLLILLDIDKILGSEDTAAVEALAGV